jgi:DNA invertase Pin-like site-specific DNA recombinase
MSEKIQPQHRSRKAILYVRQSSAFQVTHNVESGKLQYAMQGRLRDLGFTEIEIIDEDLGRSAAGTEARSGFERMVAEVCLGRVGAVAAREVSRFARNSREWQQLVELCRVVDTVLIDQETVYAPRASNDRLLLGLKGSLNEYELDLLRQRSLEARRAKAHRGELLVIAPVGFRKAEGQRLEKDPDRRVQEALRLVFDQFERIGSVRQTLLWFHEHGLELPACTARGEIVWKRPRYGTLYQILTNPLYGGAYAYGKTEHGTHYVGGEARPRTRRKPREQWLVLIPHAHEGYVEWARFERIQRAIRGNRALGGGHPGPVRIGSALLAGLLRCRRCAAKLTVHYTGSRHDVTRYLCHRAWLDKGQPRCIGFGAVRVDAAVAAEVLRAVQPAAIEAAIVASQEESRKRDEVLAALQRDLEAARYAAQRTQRQYDAADPENRLVADELERRWNQALERVRKVERRIAQHSGGAQKEETPATVDEFSALAEQLEALWQHPDTDARLRKRIVRSLIHEVVVDVDCAASEILLVIHWKGGLHTEVRVPRRRRGQNSTHTPPHTIDAVRALARICPDSLIASVLNRNGLRTGRGNFWTRERVTALRSHHEIPVYAAERRVSEGWLNLTEAARLVGVSARTLRLATERGELKAEHPLPDGPWTFHRSALEAESAQALVSRARARHRQAAVPAEQQGILDLSMT